MQYQLESPSNKSVTSVIIPDEFYFVYLNGEIYERSEIDGERDTFVCVGGVYNVVEDCKPAGKRETMAEQMHRLHGLPTFSPAEEK